MNRQKCYGIYGGVVRNLNSPCPHAYKPDNVGLEYHVGATVILSTHLHNIDPYNPRQAC
jgi:hypothetical protein